MIDPRAPAPEKYVFRILVHSLRRDADDPQEGTPVALALRPSPVAVANEPAMVYASAVEKGDVLNAILERELRDIFGITEYKIMEVQDAGAGFDSEGEATPQLAVHVHVPYFETDERQAAGLHMSWAETRPPVATEDVVRAIQEYAEAHRTSVKTSFGADLDYDEASILALDGIITRGWPLPPQPEEIESLALFFGSFLGQAMTRVFGGNWAPLDQGWVVEMKNKSGEQVVARPFNKMQKRFMGGEAEESITEYYQTVKMAVEK